MPPHCESMGTDTSYEHIQQVSLNTLNNISGNNDGYADFSNQKTELEFGQSYEINLTPGYKDSEFNESWRIWIDYNNDGDFEDEGELVVSVTAIGHISAFIDVPDDLIGKAETIMRVSMKYNNDALPCQTFTYGEVEDYTLILTDKKDPCNDDIYDGFEHSYGNWNDGSTDCTRVAEYANTGSWSVRLRDNSGVSSSLTTNNLALSSYNEISIDFSYYPNSMEDGEDFWLQISTDGGSEFTTIQTWTSGKEFYNNNRYYESITIGDIRLTDYTQLRLRCDASANADQVYIDDILISACSVDDHVVGLDDLVIQNHISDLPSIVNNDKNKSEEDLLNKSNANVEFGIYPNPAIDKISFKISGDQTTYKSYDIKIIDLYGNIVQEQKSVTSIESFKLDITNLLNGMYLVVIGSEGGIIGSCKVMVTQ